MAEWVYTPGDWHAVLVRGAAPSVPPAAVADDMDRWLREYRRWRAEGGYEPTPEQNDRIARMYITAGALGQLFTPWMLE
jgi:hypothetical protein